MNRINKWTLIIVCFLTSFGSQADDKPETVNTGQDPTAPLVRMDIRWDSVQLPDASNPDEEIFIIRADAPIPLGNKGSAGTLYFRMDVPFVSLQSTGLANPGAMTMGSVYLQFMHIAPPSWGTFWGNKGWAYGLALQVPTSTYGREEATYIPTVGAKWNLNKSGSKFFTPVMKYLYGGEEESRGFDEINELHLMPIINFGISKGIDFVTLWGNYEWVINLTDGSTSTKQSGDIFIPWDITVGKLLSGGKVVISLTAAGKLVDANVTGATGRQGHQPLFDSRYMFRLGFFF